MSLAESTRGMFTVLLSVKPASSTDTAHAFDGAGHTRRKRRKKNEEALGREQELSQLKKQFRFYGCRRVPHTLGIFHPRRNCFVSFMKRGRRTNATSSGVDRETYREGWYDGGSAGLSRWRRQLDFKTDALDLHSFCRRVWLEVLGDNRPLPIDVSLKNPFPRKAWADERSATYSPILSNAVEIFRSGSGRSIPVLSAMGLMRCAWHS